MARQGVIRQRKCKDCGDLISRAAPLRPTQCIGCYVMEGKREQQRSRNFATLPRPALKMTRTVNTVAVPAFVAQPKDEAHRDRKLLDLAHRVQECQNCGKWSEHGCEPAHANGAEWGKGMSRKADDWAHAALCHACHAWLDQGFGSSPCGQYKGMDRQAMWTRAHFRTFSLYWRNQWLGVK